MSVRKYAPELPEDESVATVGEVEGDRGIPQVGRARPATRLWWIMGVGVLIVCLVAMAAVLGLNKVKNRNRGGEAPDKAAVTTNVPELSQSAFSTSEEAPPLPEGMAPVEPTVTGTEPAQHGQPRQLSPAEQAAIDLAERRKRAPVIGMAGAIPREDDQAGGRGGMQSQGNASGALGQALRATRTGAVAAALLPEPDLTLTQGRLLQCTLETAISTDVAGMTSCVLAQDVYSTTGRVLLLERGTRIVGQYQSGSVRRGQSRLFMLWTRAETPNGVLINLDSPATDPLGRSGVDGKINSHFFERFGAAILVSVVDDVASYLVAKERQGSGGNTTIAFGNTADSGRDAASIIVENSINIPPTLNKAQGESVGIFVARDLFFGDVYELKPTRTIQ